MLLCSAILRSRADSLRLHVIVHEQLAFYSAFWISTEVLAWLVPHETAAVSAQVLCTPYNLALCHFMQSHRRKVHACLAVACHLHFWQNDRSFMCCCAISRDSLLSRRLTALISHVVLNKVSRHGVQPKGIRYG